MATDESNFRLIPTVLHVAAQAATIVMLNDSDESEDCTDDETAGYVAFIREDHVKIGLFYEETVQQMLDEQFRRLFRLTKETFNIMVEHLDASGDFQNQGFGGRDKIDTGKACLMVLTYLTSTRSLLDIATQFDVTEFALLKYRKVMMDRLVKDCGEYIKWPSVDSRPEVETGFRAMRGFPHVVGCIDGSHIRIKAPGVDENPEAFVNRKQYHSYNIQAVVNHKMFITDLFLGYPGSVHDSRLLRLSPLAAEFRMEDFTGPEGDEEYVLLGDGGYPLKSWLITPYRDNGRLTAQQRHFNYIHSSTRMTVERAFGILKGRFRRLQYMDVKDPSTRLDIITTCCILHNICLQNNDFLPERDIVQDEAVPVVDVDNVDVDGEVVRDRLCRYLNANA